jgi:hypothetical protein
MNGTFEIQPGECFGCLALHRVIFESLSFQGRPWRELVQHLATVPLKVQDDYWLAKKMPFPVDGKVERKLGDFVAERLNDSEVVLTVKRPAPQGWHPLYEGTDERKRIIYFQLGLAVWLGIPQFDRAVLLIGARDQNDTLVLPLALKPGFSGSTSQVWSGSKSLSEPAREQLSSVVRGTRETQQWSLTERLASAGKFADRLKQIIECHVGDYKQGRKPPRYWRVNSGVAAFFEGCRSPLYNVRIHQYVRAIESFLPPTAWGQKEFAEKASMLIGSDRASIDALKELYRLRNKAEHHEYFEHAGLSGPITEEVAWLRAWQAEVLCLELYRRLFTNSSAFLNAYLDSASIESFWASGAVQPEWATPFLLPHP